MASSTASKLISAQVSPETHAALDQYAEAHGMRKGHLIEMALLHHLQALQELPAEAIVPPRLVVTAESGQRMLEAIERAEPPNAAMRALVERAARARG